MDTTQTQTNTKEKHRLLMNISVKDVLRAAVIGILAIALIKVVLGVIGFVASLMSTLILLVAVGAAAYIGYKLIAGPPSD